MSSQLIQITITKKKDAEGAPKRRVFLGAAAAAGLWYAAALEYPI
jgi:hypothetical protein